MNARSRLVASIVGSLCIVVGVGIVLAIVNWPSDDRAISPNQQATGLSEQPMIYPDFCKAFTRGSNPYLGEQTRDTLREVATTSDQGGTASRADLHIRLAEEELKFGNADEAIRLLRAVTSDDESGTLDGRQRAAEHALALANLRKGELENCLRPDSPAYCLWAGRDNATRADRKLQSTHWGAYWKGTRATCGQYGFSTSHT